MPSQKHQPETEGHTLVWLVVEMVVYGIFVFAYFLLVLHFLGGWLKELFDDHKTWYALVALVCMVAQAVLFESVATALFRLIRGRFK